MEFTRCRFHLIIETPKGRTSYPIIASPLLNRQAEIFNVEVRERKGLSEEIKFAEDGCLAPVVCGQPSSNFICGPTVQDESGQEAIWVLQNNNSRGKMTAWELGARKKRPKTNLVFDARANATLASVSKREK